MDLFGRCSPWSLFFLTLFVLLLLLCFHQRIFSTDLDESDNDESHPKMPSPEAEEDNGTIFRRFRRQMKPARQEFFGHLLSMRDYVSDDQFSILQPLYDHYKLLQSNKTRTIGMEYVDFFMPGEINLDKLDSDSLKRLQTQAIVDEIAKSGGKLVEGQIRKVIRRQAELREVNGDEKEGRVRKVGKRTAKQAKTQSESRHKLQTDAWDVCLGQQDTLCNGHLPSKQFWLCACSLAPQHHSPPDPPPCSKSFRIRSIKSKVFTVVLLFPLPELFASQSSFPHLADRFLAHWMAISLHHNIRWDQVLILRKQCMDEHFFAIQMAFLNKTASEIDELKVVEDQDLSDIEGDQIRGGRALWMDQAVMERAFAEEIGHLLPEAMSESAYYRREVAQLGVRPCATPWDYLSFVRCHPLQLLFLTCTSVLVLGFPLGAFRFYHQLMTASEVAGTRRRRRGRRAPEAQEQVQRQELLLLPLSADLGQSSQQFESVR